MNKQTIIKSLDILLNNEHLIDSFKPMVLNLAKDGLLLDKVEAVKNSELLKACGPKKLNLKNNIETRINSREEIIFSMSISDVAELVPQSDSKIKSKAVKESGMYPVIDQGKSYISGYTNENQPIQASGNPVVIFGDHTRNLKFVDFDFVVGADGVKILRPYSLNAKYFFYMALALKIESRGYGRHFRSFRSKHIPILSLNDQIRTVKIIEEIFATFDLLQERIAERKTSLNSARESAINAIATAQTSEELKIAWARIQNYWEEMTGDPRSIDSIRNLILSMAVSGNLTQGYDAQDTVDQLLKDAGKIIKAYPEMSNERFAIPSHWKWVPLASIADHQIGKMLNSAKMQGVSRKYLRTVNVRPDGTIDITDLKEMLIPESELQKYGVSKGDIFVNEGGDAGRSAVFDLEVQFQLAFQNHLHRVRPVCEIESQYLQFVLRQAKNLGVMDQMSVGVTIQNFSANSLRRFAIPLPPVSEQSVIVQRVNDLMAICDDLEHKLLKKEKLAEDYAISIVAASADKM